MRLSLPSLSASRNATWVRKHNADYVNWARVLLCSLACDASRAREALCSLSTQETLAHCMRRDKGDAARRRARGQDQAGASRDRSDYCDLRLRLGFPRNDKRPRKPAPLPSIVVTHERN